MALGTYIIPNALERSRAGLIEWKALYSRMQGILDTTLRNQLFTEPFATRRVAERTEMILANQTLLDLAKVVSQSSQTLFFKLVTVISLNCNFAYFHCFICNFLNVNNL